MPRSVDYSQIAVTYRPGVVGDAPPSSRREIMRALLAKHAAPSAPKRAMWRTGYVSAMYDVAAILRRLVVGIPAHEIADALDERAGQIQRHGASS